MKKKIIITTLSIVTIVVSFLLGKTQDKTTTVIKDVEKVVEVEIIPANYINTNSDEFYNNYIDMRQVIDYTVNEYGLQLYTSDGSGYWYEK